MNNIEKKAFLDANPIILEAFLTAAFGIPLTMIDDHAGEECPFCHESTNDYCNESVVHAEDCKITRVSKEAEELGYTWHDLDRLFPDR